MKDAKTMRCCYIILQRKMTRVTSQDYMGLNRSMRGILELKGLSIFLLRSTSLVTLKKLDENSPRDSVSAHPQDVQFDFDAHS